MIKIYNGAKCTEYELFYCTIGNYTCSRTLSRLSSNTPAIHCNMTTVAVLKCKLRINKVIRVDGSKSFTTFGVSTIL